MRPFARSSRRGGRPRRTGRAGIEAGERGESEGEAISKGGDEGRGGEGEGEIFAVDIFTG
jgi:hypothetical protein